MSTSAGAGQAATQSNVMAYDNLEQQALNIETSIQEAKARIAEATKPGLKLAGQISQRVEEDKYVRMQRYEVFISKMEQLARAEEGLKDFHKT